ncbi:hypothetical protein D3C74_404210 [compost metagenome]
MEEDIRSYPSIQIQTFLSGLFTQCFVRLPSHIVRDCIHACFFKQRRIILEAQNVNTGRYTVLFTINYTCANYILRHIVHFDLVAQIRS